MLETARDNVLLEYGIFVTQLGRDRTVIVREGRSKLPADVMGITFQPASHDPATTAEEIVAHFDKLFSDPLPPQYPHISILADATLVERQMQTPLPASWHQRDLYIGIEGAKRWLSVTRSPSGVPKDYERLVNQMLVRQVENVEARTFVSFGPGDAELDRDILVKLQRHVPWIQYVPVDICQGLLQHATCLLRQNVRVPVAILGDFEDGLIFISHQLRTYARPPRLFGLLGNTFGNLDVYEQNFLDSLHSSMEPKDVLLVEVFVLGPKWQWDLDKHTKHDGYHEALRRFIATGISHREGVPVESIVNDFDKWVRFERGASDVPDAISIEVINAKSARQVFSIRRYNYDSLCSWFARMNFRVEKAEKVVEPDGVRGTGIFLLKQKET